MRTSQVVLLPTKGQVAICIQIKSIKHEHEDNPCFVSLQINTFELHEMTTLRIESQNKFAKTTMLTSCLTNIGKLSFHVQQVLKRCAYEGSSFFNQLSHTIV